MRLVRHKNNSANGHDLEQSGNMDSDYHALSHEIST